MGDKEKSDSERLAIIEMTVNRIEKTINGNGKPGLIDNFNTLKAQHQIVYDRQKNCLANQKEHKVDLKWVAVFIIAIVSLFSKYF